MALHRASFHCPLCGHNTPLPDGWKSEDGRPECEGPGCAERQRRRREDRKLEEEKADKARVERRKVTIDDRAKRKAEGYPDTPFLLQHYYIPEYGRQGWMVTCSVCGDDFRLFEWSYNGGGKRCPKCKTRYKGNSMLWSRPGSRRSCS